MVGNSVNSTYISISLPAVVRFYPRPQGDGPDIGALDSR